VRESHDGASAGHFCIKKTTNRKRAYWFEKKSNIHDVVSKCDAYHKLIAFSTKDYTLLS